MIKELEGDGVWSRKGMAKGGDYQSGGGLVLPARLLLHHFAPSLGFHTLILKELPDPAVVRCAPGGGKLDQRLMVRMGVCLVGMKMVPGTSVLNFLA
jgi:hypothetical protein